MKPGNRFGIIAVACVFCMGMSSTLSAQASKPQARVGVPQDWSQRHIIFTREGLAKRPDLLERDPRILHQAMQRWRVPDAGVFEGTGERIDEGLGKVTGPTSFHHLKPRDKRDWNVILQGHLNANMFPAKYSFDPSQPPDCTNDYVVFGLGVPGVTAGRPNFVGFNNLYSGTSPVGLCGTAPSVLFAYNVTTMTGGKVLTSPILSLDGTKIAFVESVGGATPSAIFHVLTWSATDGGTLTSAVVPTTMTSLTFSPTSPSTTSSPWIDFGNDTVYVGNDAEQVFQITGVFGGTPTLSGSPWPVTVSPSFHITSPVLDVDRGVLMVGSANGSLYQIDTTTGNLSSLVVGSSGGTSPGILAPPVVDITNGTTFVVSANDGTSAVLAEADTSSLTQLAKARIGLGSAGGTSLSLYEPAFSNDYYNDPSTGVIRTCGTGSADTTPWQYAFGFTGRTMQTSSTFSQQLLTSASAECTGWTEFFNPNVGAGTDFFFFGLTQDCTGTGTAFGCVASRVDDTTPVFATVDSGPSGIVVDNYSTAAQAASIYLTTKSTADTAYKFTQSGLN